MVGRGVLIASHAAGALPTLPLASKSAIRPATVQHQHLDSCICYGLMSHAHVHAQDGITRAMAFVEGDGGFRPSLSIGL